MKLSTIQAQSLANKIYKELMEEKKRKTQDSSQEIIKKISSKDLKTLNQKQLQLSKLITEISNLKTTMTKNVIKQLNCSTGYYFMTFFYQEGNCFKVNNVNIVPKNSIVFTVSTIKDELIVATIDSSDINDVIKKIKEKFSK